jgi:arylsulfatase A-like enzyme
MHTCYRISERVPHPEIGAVIARYLGNPDADLPSFVRLGPTGNGGAGYLGPRFEPFSLDRAGRLPYFTTPYLSGPAQQRRGDLLRFVEEQFAQEHRAEAFASHRMAEARAERLLRARAVFDISRDWPLHRERYGDTDFGRGCFLARKLVEAGVPFVEVGQDNYDSHADNFNCHKANLRVLDPAWSGLLHDLQQRGLLEDTLVVWMGEVGRTPYINNRAGRDHYIRAWTIVLAGGGIRGGQVHGATDADGREVREHPVSEGDLFATIYTVLGIDPRVRHYVGTRPIWATPEGSRPIQALIG